VTGLEGGYYPHGFNLAPLKIAWVENGQSDEIRMSVDPVQKGWGIHDPKAKVTIQGTDGTDTFDFDAVQSSQNESAKQSPITSQQTIESIVDTFNRGPAFRDPVRAKHTGSPNAWPKVKVSVLESLPYRAK
jgi:hypothetical protein